MGCRVGEAGKDIAMTLDLGFDSDRATACPAVWLVSRWTALR
jgi:hypothetical protein